MKLLFSLTVAFFAACATGCQEQANISGAEQTDQPAAKPAAPVQQNVADSEETQDASYWEKVNRLYEKAKSSGQTSAKSAKAWLAELYGEATSKGGSATTDTAQWIVELYNKAKESGETTAANSKEWLAEDIAKMGTWQYMTLVMDVANPTAIEAELNKLGSQRWECFWVDRQGERTTFYLKKASRSFIRQLPLRQLLLLLPLLSIGSSGSSE